MHKAVYGVAAAGVILLAGMAAEAAPVPLNLVPRAPDISVNNIAGTVGGGDGTVSGGGFSVTGDPVTLDVDGGGADFNILAGSFMLVADLEGDGDLVGGTFSISGIVLGTSYSSTLLTGELSAFGYGGVGTPFEFVYTVTGGDLADTPDDPFYSFLNDIGAGGIIMSSAGFDGDFGRAQSVSGLVADVFVPIPGAVWLFGSALAALVGLARRSQA